jgi:hypothetical protein
MANAFIMLGFAKSAPWLAAEKNWRTGGSL